MSKCDELRKLLLEWGESKYLPLLEEAKQLKQVNYRLREQNSRLRHKNNRLEDILEGRNVIAPDEGKTIYAVFDRKKKEKLIVVGTIQECAEFVGKSVSVMQNYASPNGRKSEEIKIVKVGRT